MLDDFVRQVAEIAPVRREIAHVPPRKSVNRKNRAIDHEQPGKEEMPHAAHGEPLRPGQRRPVRKATRRHHAIHTRGAEHAGGIELPRPQLSDSLNDCTGGILDRCNRKERMSEIRLFSPVERRVRIEDLQAAHQHHQQHARVQPVRNAHENRVAVEQNPRLAWIGVRAEGQEILDPRNHHPSPRDAPQHSSRILRPPVAALDPLRVGHFRLLHARTFRQRDSLTV